MNNMPSHFKKNIFFLSFFSLLILLFTFAAFFRNDLNHLVDFFSTKTNPTQPQIAISCYTKTTKFVRGHSMEPLIKAGAKLTLLEGYYKCNPIKRNDIVAYNYKGSKNPIIKRVAVSGGDRLEWKGNHLIVNDQILTNNQNKPYYFSRQEKKMISLYIKDGKLINNAYLLFGEEVSNSIDSRKFGAVGKRDIIGKFDVSCN